MTVKTKLTPLGRRRKPYKKDFILFESGTPGTYTIEIKSGIFELMICGAGGGGGGSATKHSWLGSNGGSGAAFKGEVKLSTSSLQLTIGQGGNGGPSSGRNAGAGGNGTASSIYQNSVNLITTGAGNGGGGTGDGAGGNNGNGGTLTIGGLNIVSSSIQSNGVAKSTVSVLENNFGAGGAAQSYNSGTNGQNGYIKIQFIK